ncbi:unnamed protein product [Angiostrongylus costaricensis]|uniref:WD_REPEATS_REGION domain-containing protein n=1 Tax=Angiostrongylus costaricensis TaxID=334426 RepID=A0A158PIB8_ANGCS|nr:unnamed protein product [Angiostrongylus costaricensis]
MLHSGRRRSAIHMRMPASYSHQALHPSRIALVQCTWVVCRFSPHSETMLYLGDDEGNIGIVDIAPVVSSDFSPFFVYHLISFFYLSDYEGFVAHDATVMDVVGVPNCPDQLLSISGDTTVRLWDLQRQHSTLYFGHEMSVRSVCFAPENYVFATGGRDGQIRLWDTRTSCFRKQGKLFKKPVNVYKNAHVLYRKLSDDWFEDFCALLRISGITSLCLDRYGSSLFAAVTDNSVYEYGVLSSNREPSLFSSVSIECPNFSCSFVYKHFHDFLLCGSKNKHAVMWDLQVSLLLPWESLPSKCFFCQRLFNLILDVEHRLPSVVEFGDSVCSKMLSEQDRALQNSPRKLTVSLAKVCPRSSSSQKVAPLVDQKEICRFATM